MNLFPLEDFSNRDGGGPAESIRETMEYDRPSHCTLVWPVGKTKETKEPPQLLIEMERPLRRMFTRTHEELVEICHFVLKLREVWHAYELNYVFFADEMPSYKNEDMREEIWKNEKMDVIRALLKEHRANRLDLVMAVLFLHRGPSMIGVVRGWACMENLALLFRDADDLEFISTGLDILGVLSQFDLGGPEPTDLRDFDCSKEDQDRYKDAVDYDLVWGPRRLFRTLALRTRQRWIRRGVGLLLCVSQMLRWRKRAVMRYHHPERKRKRGEFDVIS